MAKTNSMLDFDVEGSKKIEAIYTTDDVAEQRRRTVEALKLRPGERVLDIGCGPGLLACEMAEATGPEGAVFGIDVSAGMLALAERRQAPDRAAPMEFAEGNATKLAFGDGEFDAITSTQVYEYVDDIEGALDEASRVLRPGGRLLVVDTDWDSLVCRSPDPQLTDRVLAAWDEHLVHPHLPRRLPELLRSAGFALEHSEVVPMLTVGYRKDTYSVGIIGLVTEFVPGRHGLTAEETQAWRDGLVKLGGDFFFSVNRYLFLARSP